MTSIALLGPSMPGVEAAARSCVLGRLGKAISRTPSMHVDEKSDEAILPRKRPNKGWRHPAKAVEGRASPQGEQPTGGRGSDSAPSCQVDPIDGCARSCGRVHTACWPTFDLREEPGALAAHAGICAGCAVQVR